MTPRPRFAPLGAGNLTGGISSPTVAPPVLFLSSLLHHAEAFATCLRQ